MWNCNSGYFKCKSKKNKIKYFIGDLANMFTGHEQAVNFGGFSPDGKLIVTCSDDKTLRVWKP